MIYIKTYVDCNYAGCNEIGYFCFDDETDEEEIEIFVSDWAMSLAEEYEDRCLEGDGEYDWDLIEEYYDDISFNYEVITEKEYMDSFN